jgi:hypothetical protein
MDWSGMDPSQARRHFSQGILAVDNVLRRQLAIRGPPARHRALEHSSSFNGSTDGRSRSRREGMKSTHSTRVLCAAPDGGGLAGIGPAFQSAAPVAIGPIWTIWQVDGPAIEEDARR